MQKTYEADIKKILSRRHDNGGDFWATADGRIYKGNPFSTIGSLGMLYELGVPSSHEAVNGGLEKILEASREDGRIRTAPKAPLYPCYTAEAVRMLCRFGLTGHEAVRRSVDYFLSNAWASGGWRCSFSKFGKGPETTYANPGATLYVLDVLRFFPEYREGNEVVDDAVAFMLTHWDIKKPLGPCHWGIGSLFMQVEYPFIRYNLFFYVYVLSFFEKARDDHRFKEALNILKAKLNKEKELVVERPHQKLKGLAFCAKGEPSKPGTERFLEITENVRR